MSFDLYLAIRALLGLLSLAENATLDNPGHPNHGKPVTLGDEPGLLRHLNMVTASLAGDLFTSKMDMAQAWLHLSAIACSTPGYQQYHEADARMTPFSSMVG